LSELLAAKVGDKVRFAEEKQAYTVQARSERFLICTKPFNPRRTVLYTVVDLVQRVRGTENLIFGMGAETREDCEQMLNRLERGDSEVSYRNRVPLRLAANLDLDTTLGA
jgi:hypothetical protein